MRKYIYIMVTLLAILAVNLYGMYCSSAVRADQPDCFNTGQTNGYRQTGNYRDWMHLPKKIFPVLWSKIKSIEVHRRAPEKLRLNPALLPARALLPTPLLHRKPTPDESGII